MCGIVAASAMTDVQDEVVAALARVQYRGYDSFGFAWVSEQGGLASARSTDAEAVHETCLPLSRTLLGHTRWATHGEVNLANCHPHMSIDGDFALVHNGIVTNFEALRGADLSFESDSRLIVELLQKQLESGAARLAGLRQVTTLLEGRNTIVVLFADGEILAFRQGSPLVISKSESDDLYLASDQLAFSATCQDYCRIADGEFVQILAHDLVLYSNELIARPEDWLPITEHYQASDKHGYKHFMLKEIMEQWQTVPAVLKTLETVAFPQAVTLLQGARRIIVVGAGGAYFTGRQIAWLLRNEAELDAMAIPAYEYDSFATLLGEGDVLLAVSQSGETADTMQAIERAKKAAVAVLSIINVPGSSMAELSDISLQQYSGAEVCVLSTKSATAQITVGYALARSLASAQASANRQTEARQHIQGVSHALAAELDPTYLADCKRLATRLANHPSLYVLGRADYHAVAQVAALNIKEASYVHAEAFSAGELKHGVLALITRDVPVLVYVGKSDVFMRQVIAEVQARGAWVVGLLADDACESICDESLRLPAQGSTLSSLVPGQLLAYFIALSLERNPDRPRNLAKSITVL